MFFLQSCKNIQRIFRITAKNYLRSTRKKNNEYREETSELIASRKEQIDAAKQELDKVAAKLISETEKNKEFSDTNIFGRVKKIELTAPEYRSLLLSAETKELFTEHLANLLKPLSQSLCANFVGRYQDATITAIKNSPITAYIKAQLASMGIKSDSCSTINDALLAAEEKDIIAIEGQKYSDIIDSFMNTIDNELINENELGE